jgi:PQQ-dependent catabolism-associated CXXCW motif protein
MVHHKTFEEGLTVMKKVILFFLLVLPLPALGVDLPEGFRMNHYRAATPDSVPGGVVVDVAAVERLIEQGATLVDVMGAGQFATEGLDGVWIIDKQHLSIDSGVWLPNVGRGYLSQRLEAFFRTELNRLSGDNLNHHLVFYCVADCWMAWNAAKRAGLWGYANVNWFPEGTDGWKHSGHALVHATPTPLSLAE